MITQNNSINKFTSIIVVLMMVFSLISISTIKSFAEVGDVIEEGNFKYTVLDENSVSLTSVIDKDISGDQIIPEEVNGKKVVEIGTRAFYNCQQMTSVQIPDTVKTIKEYAFNKCLKLTKIEIPDSVTTLGIRAFSGCSKATELKISKSLTSIPDYAFSTCRSLKEVEIPDNISTLGIFAFIDCESLEEVTIPKSITNPYLAGQFKGCKSLKTIKGYKGSAARTFSRIGGYNFIALDAVEGEEELEVKFDPDNGDAVVTQYVYKDEEMNYDLWSKFPLIEKKGYTIVGRYADTDDISTEYKNNQTYTESVTYKAKWAHVEIQGAQAKSDKSGIRFGTKIYNDGDKIIEKGTVILPEKMLQDIPEDIYYGFRMPTLKTKNVAKSVGRVNYEVNTEENYIVYLGTLINVPESKRDTYIAASAYVIYEDKAGNQYTVYDCYTTTINNLLKSE